MDQEYLIVLFLVSLHSYMCRAHGQTRIAAALQKHALGRGARRRKYLGSVSMR